MTGHSTLDEKTFQSLLSDSFVVQQSGIETEFLASTVELQRAIATGELDLDGSMDVIAARALDVAHASGTAIALLQGDQLVYRAGSGSGASQVGRHVMAALCGSVHRAGRAILRVENARTDARIEAAVCRQFGAESLLILPICHAGVLAGLLHVMFDAAHVFQPREVRSYQLMAALLGEAMSCAKGREQADSPAGNRSIQAGQDRIGPPFEATAGICPAPAAAPSQAIDEPREGFMAELPAINPSSGGAREQADRVRLYKDRWQPALAASAVLVIGCWIGFRDRRPTPTLEPPAPASVPLDWQMRALPAQPVSANSNANSKPRTAPVRENSVRKTARTHPGQVMDGTTRVRYFSDDVTVRYFFPASAPQRVVDGKGQVRHFSKDVTVRYFNSQSAVSPSPPSDGSSAQRVNR